MVPSATSDQIPFMLQALPAERFHLKFHSIHKQISGWALALTKDGLHLESRRWEEANPVGRRRGGVSAGRAYIEGVAGMDDLARMLSFKDHTVVDFTGQSGLFDVHLQWEPYQNSAMTLPDAGPSSPATTASDPAGFGNMYCPSLFKALDRAGLKLEARKIRMEILVIDSAEKPADN